MFNALQSIQAFEAGTAGRKERERETAMKSFGNALSMNDYEGASKIGFGIDPALGMQARQYGESQNALALNKQIAPLVASGNYTEAMTLAAPFGNLDLVTQLQQFKQNATVQQRQEAAFKAEQLAKIATGYEGMDPEQAAALWQQDQVALQHQYGFDPAELAQFNPSDPQDLKDAVLAAQTLADIQAGQRWEEQQAYTQKIDERNWQAEERARREASTPRDSWQSAGEGYIFNNRTGETRRASEGGGQGGYGGDPASDNLYIPTSADAMNPFLQLQFGGTPTQGAEGGMLFDNGEIYTQGANGAQSGGGVPPNIDQNMYQRYRSSEYAKTDSKVAKEAREAAIKANTQTLPKLTELKSLATQFPSGALSDVRYEAGRWLPIARGNVGMTEAEMAARDAFVSQTKGYVLDLASVMKGALSDSDRNWVESMGAKTTMNKESIDQVLNVAERMIERQEFYAQGAEVWSNQYGGLSMTDPEGKNFYQAWSDWSSMNPITGGTYGGDAPTSGQSRRGGDDRKGGGPKYERTATNPQTGEKIGLVNGKWVPIQ